MKLRIVNLTPHNVVADGIEYPAQSMPVRVYEEYVGICKVNGHEVVSSILGEVEDLPPEMPNVYLIVSRMVFDACQFREDLLVPADLVRDSHGQIIGCKRFIGRKRHNVSVSG